MCHRPLTLSQAITFLTMRAGALRWDGMGTETKGGLDDFEQDDEDEHE